MKKTGFFQKMASALLPYSRRNPVVTARYDAAQTTVDNASHWSMATSMSADAENSPEVRRRIRNRARYESANNPWLNGLVSSRAADVIGTRPRLQLRSGNFPDAAMVEADFMDWAKKIHLGQKLRTALQARVRDGEAFLVMVSNPGLRHRVKLDLRLIEADRVTAPFGALDPHNIDGVIIDESGGVISYEILKIHPGSNTEAMNLEKVVVPAEFVIHLFNCSRPEQHRGVSELASALPLVALLRRYMLAMVQKMETSANVVGTVETELHADPEDLPEAFDHLEMPRNGMLTLPAGSKFSQANLGTPSDSQNEFATQVKIETARALKMPRNAALGDSSGYNYASGRLDWQGYSKVLQVERAELEECALDRILSAFLAEYRPGTHPEDALPEHVWYWDGREHVDPLKEANAALNLNAGGLETMEHYFARQGRDWEMELLQKLDEEKFEMDERRKRGLPPRGVSALNQPEGEEEENG